VASGQPVAALWQGYADPLAWGAILWASLGPGALAAFLQTQVRPCLRQKGKCVSLGGDLGLFCCSACECWRAGCAPAVALMCARAGRASFSLCARAGAAEP